MKYLIKPLTKQMLTHLQKGRSIGLSKNEANICSTVISKIHCQNFTGVAGRHKNGDARR